MAAAAAQQNANVLADVLVRLAAAEGTIAQYGGTIAEQGGTIAEQGGMLATAAAEAAELQLQLAEANVAAVTATANNAIPPMSDRMAARTAPVKDIYVQLRVAWAVLCRDPQPDVAKLKEVLGKVIRLSGAVLTGAELSAQSMRSQPHEFLESYYKLAKPACLKVPEAAGWEPSDILITDESALEKVKKVEKADRVREAAAAAEREAQRRRLQAPPYGGNNNNRFQPPRGAAPQQAQPQQPQQQAGGPSGVNGGNFRPGGNNANFVPGAGGPHRR